MSDTIKDITEDVIDEDFDDIADEDFEEVYRPAEDLSRKRKAFVRARRIAKRKAKNWHGYYIVDTRFEKKFVETPREKPYAKRYYISGRGRRVHDIKRNANRYVRHLPVYAEIPTRNRAGYRRYSDVWWDID